MSSKRRCIQTEDMTGSEEEPDEDTEMMLIEELGINYR